MTKLKKRPINLDLTTIRFPITALASITHRMSGVVLFLCIPLLLWLFGYSLASAEHFETLANAVASVWGRLAAWAILSLLLLHLLGGIRHLLIDLHIGENRHSGRIAVILMVICWLALAAGLGVWLW